MIKSSPQYEILVEELGEHLKQRSQDTKFEFGWENEYRLCILEYSEQNNRIKELKMVDQADDFWPTQVQNQKDVQCQPNETTQPRSEWV